MAEELTNAVSSMSEQMAAMASAMQSMQERLQEVSAENQQVKEEPTADEASHSRMRLQPPCILEYAQTFGSPPQ